MFLIRWGMILAVVVMLLPTDERQQAKLARQASETLYWTMTFCDRNAQTCETGRSLWATFVKKAEYGAKLAGELIQQKMAGAERAEPAYAPADVPGSASAPRPMPAIGTLTPQDLEPRWRGAQVRPGA